MTKLEIGNTVQMAIENAQSVTIKFKHGVGEELTLPFDPYIYGDDTMQYSFVWGYLPQNNLYYKFMFDIVTSVKLTPDKFSVKDDAVYLYAIEEEHWCRVSGIEEPELRIYATINQ